MIVTDNPVSSPTSRSAVCSSDSPGSGVPFGSAQRPSLGRPTSTTSMPRSPRRRYTTPPADVATRWRSRPAAPFSAAVILVVLIIIVGEIVVIVAHAGFEGGRTSLVVHQRHRQQLHLGQRVPHGVTQVGRVVLAE